MLRILHWTSIGVLAAMLLASCAPREQDPGEAVGDSGAAEKMATDAVPRPPAPEELANATFSGILDEPVTLVDGRWQGKPYEPGAATRPSVQLVRDFYLAGDIDGDGVDEAVVLLAASPGGSGTFLHLAVAGRDGGRVVERGSAAVGDRVQVRRAELTDGKLILEVVQQGPGDPACCPAELARRVWTLDSRGPVESASEVTGRLSLDALAGPEWLLTHWTWNEPAAAEPEVTLAYEEGRVVGASGCNRYFAGAEDGEMPGDLEISAAGTTRMACPPAVMEVESRFLAALGGANHYGFVAGKLAIGYESGEAIETLLFRPREAGD